MSAPKQWRLTWGEISFTAADVTAEDIAAVDAITGCGWHCDPQSGPNVAANLLAIVVSRMTGTDMRAEVASASALELVAALDFEDAVPTPVPF